VVDTTLAYLVVSAHCDDLESTMTLITKASTKPFQSSFRAVSEKFQSSFSAVSEQFQSTILRAVSEQFQSSFRAVSEQI